MTVSVEISDPEIVPGHQQSMREIQRLLVTQTNVREKWTLQIDNPDGGLFQIGILNPKTREFWWSKDLNTNSTGHQLAVALNPYYGDLFSAGLHVFLVYYDADGNVTFNSRNAAQTIITFSCARSISIPSTN
jgi:hypothetical protein